MDEQNKPGPTGDSIEWCITRLQGLTPLQLLRIMRARQEVFVVEQNCVYLDADDADEVSWHLAGWRPDGQLCAYARIVDPGVRYPEASIGRVITTLAARGQGLGREVVQRAIRHASQVNPGTALRISAQNRLQRFYAGLGFNAVGDVYLEDGIPHIAMLRAAECSGLAGMPSSDGDHRSREE